MSSSGRPGDTPTIDTTTVTTTTATPLCVDRLRCQPDTIVVRIDRRFLADGHPAIYIQEMVLADQVRGVVTAEQIPNSIFEFADSYCLQPVEHTVVEIVSAQADEQIAGLLGMHQGDPYLRLIETHYSPTGRPFIASDIRLVDRYIHFIVVRRRF